MVKIGIIGTGNIAGYHAHEYKKIKGVKITSCCDTNEKRCREFAKKFGIPKIYTDYREMLANEELDGVTNSTPDAMHAEISIAVAKQKIAVLCEKPMAVTLKQARKMLDAVNEYKVINMVNFSYRVSSALQQAAKVIASGSIGRLIHVESSYLQSWLCNSWGNWWKKDGGLWRLSYRHGSKGVLGDIGCHIYDMTTLLCGDIKEIYCRLETFDKGFPGNRVGK